MSKSQMTPEAVRESLEIQAEAILKRAEEAHAADRSPCGTEFCPILRREIARAIVIALTSEAAHV